MDRSDACPEDPDEMLGAGIASGKSMLPDRYNLLGGMSKTMLASGTMYNALRSTTDGWCPHAESLIGSMPPTDRIESKMRASQVPRYLCSG